jgi:hypothetical protein
MPIELFNVEWEVPLPVISYFSIPTKIMKYHMIEFQCDHVTNASMFARDRDVQVLLVFTTFITMAQAGLLEWSNSIRFNMATDPGRQLFQDQINTYGFLFLDDYLDNILCGAKQE